MGLFGPSRPELESSVCAAFLDDAERATVRARAIAWAQQVLLERQVDPAKSILAIKTLRDAKPGLGLAEAKALFEMLPGQG